MPPASPAPQSIPQLRGIDSGLNPYAGAWGRVIHTLTDREYAPGSYKLTFEKPGLASGVYYARLQNGPVQQVRSMLKLTR